MYLRILEICVQFDYEVSSLNPRKANTNPDVCRSYTRNDPVSWSPNETQFLEEAVASGIHNVCSDCADEK